MIDGTRRKVYTKPMVLFRKPVLWLFCFFILFSSVLFRDAWPTDTVLESQDYNYGLIALYDAELPASLTEGFWRSGPLLGKTGRMAPTWTNLLLGLLPPEGFVDLIYPLSLLLASAFFIAFCRLRGLGWLPAACGAVTAYWLGSNLTLLFPGHMLKFSVVMFASITLYCLERSLQSPQVRWSILSGGALGMMFMQQADLALFFGGVLGLYLLNGVLFRIGWQPLNLARILLPLWLPALLLTLPAYMEQMSTQVEPVKILQQGSEEERWQFTTQWSWPPQESLALIAPGIHGWYTGHPENPYTGIAGQSASYSADKAGFKNFKMESVYLGILSFGLAACSLLWLRSSPAPRSREILFWATICVVTYLLACGKFFPFYAAFQRLPLVRYIRNPNKFMQVFQWVCGLLVAYGLEALSSHATRVRFRLVTAMAFLLIGGASLIHSLSLGPEIPSPAETNAWMHLSLFAFAGAGLTGAMCTSRGRRVAPALILLLMSSEALALGKIYLQPTDIRHLKDNPLTTLLSDNPHQTRVAVFDTSALYGYTLSHLLPAGQIPFANISVAPRLDAAYEIDVLDRIPSHVKPLCDQGIHPLTLLQGGWLSRMGRPPLHTRESVQEMLHAQVSFWRDFGVEALLMPKESAAFLQQALADILSLQQIFRYDVVMDEEGALQWMASPEGAHVVLHISAPPTRFTLLKEWQEQGQGFATSQPKGAHSDGGKILSVIPESTGFRLRVEVTSPAALLRLADRYDPGIEVTVGNRPATALQPVDGLFCGTVLPSGIHDITLRNRISTPFAIAQPAGLLITAIALLLPAFRLQFFKEPPPE